VAPDQVERRLAVILAADVAGYSRLMAADEEGTLKTLTLYRGVMNALIGFWPRPTPSLGDRRMQRAHWTKCAGCCRSRPGLSGT
jgi:hypothetical protein